MSDGSFFLPLSVLPLADPKFDPGNSIILDAETARISAVTNRDFAEAAVAAINLQAELLQALKAIMATMPRSQDRTPGISIGVWNAARTAISRAENHHSNDCGAT